MSIKTMKNACKRHIEKGIKLIAALLVLLMAIPFFSTSINANETPTGRYMNQGKSIEDIVSNWQAMNLFDSGVDTYEAVPNMDAPYDYPGSMTQRSLQFSINTVNYFRYLAGVPSVAMSDEFNRQCQAGAYAMAINRDYGHSPQNNVGMDHAIYDLGYYACSTSNIYVEEVLDVPELYISKTVIRYMEDDDVSSVGHRLCILDPAATLTGFGVVYLPGDPWKEVYSLVKAVQGDRDPNFMDVSRTPNHVAWPAPGYLPVELMNWERPSRYPWSISLNPEIYGAQYKSSVVVSLTHKNSNQTTIFYDGMPGNTNGKYFLIDETHGTPYTLIFRPDNSVLRTGDEYKVVVSGLKDINGAALPDISYDTAFFSLENFVSLPRNPRVIRDDPFVGAEPGVIPTTPAPIEIIWPSISRPEPSEPGWVIVTPPSQEPTAPTTPTIQRPTIPTDNIPVPPNPTAPPTVEAPIFPIPTPIPAAPVPPDLFGPQVWYTPEGLQWNIR